MSVLMYGLFFFFLAFLLHLAVWKMRLPRRQTRALLAIFFGALAAGLTAMWRFPSFLAWVGAPALQGPYEYLHVFLLHASMTLAYITTYSGMEVDSPSLVMTKMVAEAGKAGLPREEFFARLSDDVLVKPRVRDLLRDGLASFKDGKYAITPKGAMLARIFLFYRRLLNAPGKGG